MKTRMLSLISATLLAATLGACGSEDDVPRRGTDAGTTAAGPESASLTRDLACGFGFAKVDDGGEVLLAIHHTGTSGRATRTIELPALAWEAEVRVGRHLDANWCTDVIQEPQADVDETWEIVEGTLELQGPLPPLDWSDDLDFDTPVVAELTGVVLEGPDGEQVAFADQNLTNTAWGLLAG